MGSTSSARKIVNYHTEASPEEKLRSRAFEKGLLEHTNLLHGVALRLTRNDADAADLVQSTMLKALRFHDRFQEGTHIKAWLLTILRNAFINDYRQKARRPIHVELTGREAASQSYSPDPLLPSGGRQPSVDELMEMLDDEVKHAVDDLPNEFRSAVVMADLQGNSYKEIAAALKCPLGTVMSRIYRGRKLLRKELGEYAKRQRLAGSHA